jgi:two-component system, NtrC family, response regulator HydG
LIARACHRLSSRATGPFVAVNCSALSENLLESELFGHVRGSFTGATHDKKGRFELAHGGTIFLDEIGELSTKVQVKLLRVLQERSIERVGDDKQIPVDIRVITATHQSLNELVSHGRFRHDLYYRLRVVPFSLPPLRERRDDIPLLAQHFVEKFRERTGRSIQGVDESALSLMLDYNWPGNVREMENAIEYAFIKARRGLIRPVHLPPELLNCPLVKSVSHVPTVSRQTRRSDITRDKLEQALTRSGWNIAKTARQLGTTRNTIYKRIEEFGLATPNI